MSIDRAEGWRLYRAGEYEAAGVCFATALAADPSDYDAAIGAGRCHRLLGEWQPAIAAFGRAIDIDPQRGRGYCERGAIEILQERWADSLADYESARAVDPDYPSLEAYFAESLLRPLRKSKRRLVPICLCSTVQRLRFRRSAVKIYPP
jgi:tetratricopeptide (TPR) repeat protein